MKGNLASLEGSYGVSPQHCRIAEDPSDYMDRFGTRLERLLGQQKGGERQKSMSYLGSSMRSNPRGMGFYQLRTRQ